MKSSDLNKNFMQSGESKKEGVGSGDVDPKELAMGIKVEKEHTNKDGTKVTDAIARKISLDHLAEYKDYYTRLKKMEDQADKDMKKLGSTFGDDSEKIKQWQTTKDPGIFKDLMKQYQPLVYSVTNKYSTTGQNINTLRTEGNTQLIKAFKTFEADKGAKPVTHIYNYLKKVQRHASESLMSGHIPEARALQLSTYKIVKENMQDQLGYEPSVSQMSDEMAWDKKEVSRAESELAGETTASKAEFDFYGNSTQQKGVDKQIADYLYHELEGPEKTIFEYTFGYGGKPKIERNKEMAAKMGVNEMFISRKKRAIGERIKKHRKIM